MEMNMRKNIQILTLKQIGLATRIFMATLATAVVVLSVLWSQPLRAADKKSHVNEDPLIQQEAADFITSLANEALTSLRQDNSTLTDQETRISGILHEGFDIKYISRISLGRHRKKATKENLEKYFALFPDYLVKIYTSRLTKLDTRTVKVGRVFPNGKRDMYVRTKITNGEQKIYDVDWRVRPSKERSKATGKENSAENTPAKHSYKIVDVKIEGISMARMQRDDFTARISTSGITGLIDFMQSIVDGAVVVADNKNSDREKEKTLH